MDFEWDETKAAANRKKHKVDFEIASSFLRSESLRRSTMRMNSMSRRFNVIGIVDGKMLVVTFTMRDDVCRDHFGAKSRTHEKRLYHEV